MISVLGDVLQYFELQIQFIESIMKVTKWQSPLQMRNRAEPWLNQLNLSIDWLRVLSVSCRVISGPSRHVWWGGSHSCCLTVTSFLHNPETGCYWCTHFFTRVHIIVIHVFYIIRLIVSRIFRVYSYIIVCAYTYRCQCRIYLIPWRDDSNFWTSELTDSVNMCLGRINWFCYIVQL